MSNIMLLLAGPSAVGKSTLIGALQGLDPRFRYVRPFVTRALRPGETDKIAVSEEDLRRLWKNGDLLVINDLYGVRYGTPRAPIEQPEPGTYPIVDWPIGEVAKMRNAFRGQIYIVYVRPPNRAVLERRLLGRNNPTERLAEAIRELERVGAHEFDDLIDDTVVTSDDMILKCAEQIYLGFLARFGGGRE